MDCFGDFARRSSFLFGEAEQSSRLLERDPEDGLGDLRQAWDPSLSGVTGFLSTCKLLLQRYKRKEKECKPFTHI